MTTFSLEATLIFVCVVGGMYTILMWKWEEALSLVQKL